MHARTGMVGLAGLAGGCVLAACAAEPRAEADAELIAAQVAMAPNPSHADDPEEMQEWPRWGAPSHAPDRTLPSVVGRYRLGVLDWQGPAPAPQVIPNSPLLPFPWRRGMGESMVRDAVFWHGRDKLVVLPAFASLPESLSGDFVVTVDCVSVLIE